MVKYILLGVILFGFIFLFVILPIIYGLAKEIENSEKYGKLLEGKFEKEIKKVSEEEQKLYRKVLEKIIYNEARFWNESWYENDRVIELRNIKINAHLHDDNSYSCLNIIISDNNKTITIVPVEGQQKLFNIFSDYAIWKWREYQKEVYEKRNNEALKEHHDDIKKANKILK